MSDLPIPTSHENIPPDPESRRLKVAVRIIVVVFVATAIIGLTAGWQAVLALPAMIGAVGVLVAIVVGDARRPTPPAPAPPPPAP